MRFGTFPGFSRDISGGFSSRDITVHWKKDGLEVPLLERNKSKGTFNNYVIPERGGGGSSKDYIWLMLDYGGVKDETIARNARVSHSINSYTICNVNTESGLLLKAKIYL